MSKSQSRTGIVRDGEKVEIDGVTVTVKRLKGQGRRYFVRIKTTKKPLTPPS